MGVAVHSFLMEEPRTAEMCLVWRSVSAMAGILASKSWLGSEGFVQSLPLQISATW